MIRRNSLILFAVFLVLLAGILYINSDSNLQVSMGMQTATPTQQPKVITGFDLGNVKKEEIRTAKGINYQISANEKGNWVTENKESVDLNDLLQSTQALIELSGSGPLSANANIPLDKIGLNPPKAELILTDSKGNRGTLAIGNLTATQNDYYVRWENNPVTLVPSTQVDALMGYFSPETLLAQTPTPGLTPTP